MSSPFGGQAGRVPVTSCPRATAPAGGRPGSALRPGPASGGAGSVRPWPPDRHPTPSRRPCGSASWPRGAAPSWRRSWPPTCRSAWSSPTVRAGPSRWPRPPVSPRSWSTGPTSAGSARVRPGGLHPGRHRGPGGRRRRRRGDGRLRHRARPAGARRLPGADPEHPPGPAAGVPGLARRPRRPGRRRRRDGDHGPRRPPGDGHRADPGPGHGGRSGPDDTEATPARAHQGRGAHALPGHHPHLHRRPGVPGRGWGRRHPEEVTE